MNAIVQATPESAEVSATRPYSQWFDVAPRLGISFIDHLFNRLDGAYPHKWRSNFPNQQAIDNWAESWVEAFEDERITPTDVKVGLRECRKRYAWPPSIAEFIQACKPAIDALSAYHEATAGLEARGKGEMGTWSHPAVYWAASLLAKDLMSQTYAQVKDRWAALLKAQLEHTEWADIPEPRLALPEPGKSALSKEGAAQMLRDLGAAGIVKGAPSKIDGKRWARRILERVAAGDKSLLQIQINFAKDALGSEA